MLSRFLRERRQQILEAWSARVMELPPARDLPAEVVADQIPDMLDELARVIPGNTEDARAAASRVAAEHVHRRMSRGFDLREVLRDYEALRRTIFTLLDAEHPSVRTVEVLLLDELIDAAMCEAAIEFAHTRQRTVQALDEIASAAIEHNELEQFLSRLAHVMLANLPSAAAAAVLTREQERLVLRAVAGEGVSAAWNEVPLGEEFARDDARPGAWFGPRGGPHGWPIRGEGLRGHHSMPIVHASDLLGVAFIASRTAEAFSQQDLQLFSAMCTRAAGAIYRARTTEELRYTEWAQRFLARASRVMTESIDYAVRLQRIVESAVPSLGDACIVDIVEVDGVRRLPPKHVDSWHADAAQAMRQAAGADLAASDGVAKVLRTGSTEYHPIATKALLESLDATLPAKALLAAGTRSLVIAPIRSERQILGAITVVAAGDRCFAERHVAIVEDFAHRAASAIENARLYAEAQKALQMRERMLGLVSHDLRNELLVLISSCDTLRRLRPFEGRGEDERPLRRIAQSSRNMQRLVSDLLDMAAVAAGRLPIRPADIDLDSAIRATLESYEQLAADAGLSLELSIAGGALRVQADEHRIQQALGNLLSNALKHAKRGTAVAVSVESRGAEALVRVSDRGPGIPHEIAARLFEEFAFFDQGGRRGTGLGLYIARGIVERHGGRLWLESEPGHGATFAFTLPLLR